VGSNSHPRSGLRPVVIDGSNVAMSHGRHMNVFSVKGIKMVVEFFKERGHKNVVAFLPEYRKKNRFSTDPVSPFSVDF
jgi:ribonuclease ZC3H12